MSKERASEVPATGWLPAERLGQLSIDGTLRPWLIGKGLLTLRLKVLCGERFSSGVVEEFTALLGADLQRGLDTADKAGLFRDVEMRCDDRVWVYAQTVIPDSTLTCHPWLAELGDAALGETLSALSGFERSSYEYAWLPASDALCKRALGAAEVKPAGLWARRSRLTLRGAPLLAQELFLPSMGRL